MYSFLKPGFRSQTAVNDPKPLCHKALPFQGGYMFLFRNPGRRRKRLCPGLLYLGLSGRCNAGVVTQGVAPGYYPSAFQAGGAINRAPTFVRLSGQALEFILIFRFQKLCKFIQRLP